MKPLLAQRELLSNDQARLADLFAAAEPYRSDTLRKRRIHVRLATSHRAGWRFRWQPAVAAAALVVAGTAAAALGHRYFNGPVEPRAQQVPLALAPSAPAPAKPKRPVIQTEQEPETKAPTPSATNFATAPAPAPTAVATVPRRRAVAPSGEDPTRVAEALHALRKEGDAKRAQVLLHQYLQQNPKGALSEEALALTIEAAHARQDPKAKQHARRYLARYPKGRHRALAQRVLKK